MDSVQHDMTNVKFSEVGQNQQNLKNCRHPPKAVEACFLTGVIGSEEEPEQVGATTPYLGCRYSSMGVSTSSSPPGGGETLHFRFI